MIAIILLSVFLIGMIGIGIWGMKKTSSLNDFFLGGRSIGPWISAFAYGTTYFSAVIFIGFAGKLGWGFGLDVLWIAAGNALFGALGAWLVLGRRTRRMTQNLDVMTMPEFLQERYQGRYLKVFSAMIIFVFLLPYSASVFKGLGHLFEANFGISYDVALLVMIGITGIYLVLGGYFAITLTDFIQGMIMLLGCLALVAVMVGKGGGFSEVIGKITEGYARHVPEGARPSMLLLASLVFMTSFGTWGLPQMVQKFYAVKNEQVINKAAVATLIFAAVIGFTAYFNGSMAHIFYQEIPRIGGAPAFDRIVPDMMTKQLPEGLMALILLLVLSASMSTLSSLVLVSSSSVAIDLYKGHINPEVSADNSLMMMRFLSALFIAVSYFIARFELAFIVTLMSLSWGAVAGAFMAPYLYGLYWRRTTRIGVVAGMVTGITLDIVLFYVLGPANSPIASTAAMLAPFAVIPLVSLVTAPPDRERVDKAFGGI
ncbi:MAG: sodium:solute symporter family protein [Spirochaetes bacterium]|nr:sodium:solute symporter family protein [Spirochaetota bacterium]